MLILENNMQELNLSTIKHIHFIGIGGIGISALAKMALSRGMTVSGINDGEGKTIDSLRELGVEVTMLDMSKVPFDTVPEADMYVYSDAWIYRGPEVIESARKTGKPTLSYFEALGIFAKEYKVIAIAGTHGKTTTTAMVAEILVDAGIDPTVVVGSFVKKFGSNFRKGGSEYLVVEADEYNRHFLNFSPFITVITNIEADHLDYYKDMRDIEDAFIKLIKQTSGFLVCNKLDNSFILNSNFKKFTAEVVDYTDYLEKVPHMPVPGVHNRMNASCALAVAQILGIEESIAQNSLSTFSGTWRRLEKKGILASGVIIYDDYAHHPTEIQASLQALRELYPSTDGWRITVVFQPHLFSRTKLLLDDFAKSFGLCDQAIFLPIYFAREYDDGSISSEILCDEVNKHSHNAKVYSDFKSASEHLEALLPSMGPKDVVVTMGAGEAFKIGDQILALSTR
jgi:UDP-N-acetylmuramate--alanine ligase